VYLFRTSPRMSSHNDWNQAHTYGDHQPTWGSGWNGRPLFIRTTDSKLGRRSRLVSKLIPRGGGPPSGTTSERVARFEREHA